MAPSFRPALCPSLSAEQHNQAHPVSRASVFIEEDISIEKLEFSLLSPWAKGEFSRAVSSAP